MTKGLVPSSTNFSEVRDGRRSPVYYYDVDLTTARSVAASTHLILPLSGNSIYIDKNPDIVGPATVHIQDTSFGRGPAPVFMEPGFIAAVPFTQLLIENTAQPGKIFRIHYGTDIDFQPGASSSVNVNGIVSIVDGGKSRTRDGTALTAYASRSVAIAGDHAFVQLFNPAASGKNVYVKAVTLSCDVNNFIGVTTANTAGVGALASMSKTKRIGLADGVTEVRTVSQVAGLGPTNMLGGQVPANGSLMIVLQEPIMLPPGTGLAAGTSATTAGLLLTASWEIIEEAV